MNKRHPSKHRSLQHKGFTLVELLLVVSLVILIMGITIPSISGIRNSTIVANGTNAVKAGVAAARVYAMQQAEFLDDLDPDTPGLTTGHFSGTAIVFTPANEMRIVMNDQKARCAIDNNYPSKYRLESLDVPTPDAYNGYSDVPSRNYISIPRDSGVVGITRDSGGLQFVTPPFAIRFNEFGHMVVGGIDPQVSSDKVYYDGNYNGIFNIDPNHETYIDSDKGHDDGACARPDDYNVNQWDPVSREFMPLVEDRKNNRYYLPYEQLTCVVGVVIYSKVDFKQDGGDWDNSSQSFNALNPYSKAAYDSTGQQGQLNEWMQINGEMIFFSRFTGVPMQEFQPTRQRGGS